MGSNNKRLTTEEFVTKARVIHESKYDYSKVKYANSKTKIEILCHEHGSFWQIPYNHLNGQGCSECGKLKCDEAKKCTQEEFIIRSKLVHKDKYIYDKVKYKGTDNKIVIICHEHGEFMQTPHNHLRGVGCSECGRTSTIKKQSSNKEEFIIKAKLVHINKYDYSKTNYTNNRAKVIITCPIHGDFKQVPKDHLAGCGCPSCMACGFNPNKPAYLYYLKVTTEDNRILYKIGITNRTVNERFNLTDLTKIEIVKQKLYENGQDAYDWEQKLLKLYKQYQYKGPNVLESGNTELFTEDIIAIYYKENDLLL